jgi:hypothetical protein
MQAATDRELEAFYGADTTVAQWREANERQMAAYDADDVQTAAIENADAILAAMNAGDYHRIGFILTVARDVTVTRRVNFEMTGKVTA